MSWDYFLSNYTSATNLVSRFPIGLAEMASSTFPKNEISVKEISNHTSRRTLLLHSPYTVPLRQLERYRLPWPVLCHKKAVVGGGS